MKKTLKKILKSVLPSKLFSAAKKAAGASRMKEFEGTGVICSICNAQFRIFAPHGSPRRTNAKCLNCGSLERHRLLWKYVNEKTDFNSGKYLTLLHFAPEKIFYERFSKRPNINYFPADLFPHLYQHDSTVKVHQVDITDIPFPDHYFDVIICSHVLEHIPDDHKAMSELHRVLKPGGWAILQVPIDYSREKTYEDFSITSPEEREKAFGQYNHVRWYGRDYKNRLERVNFFVREDDYVTKFTKEDIFRFGFSPHELIYYCTSKKNAARNHESRIA